MCCHICAISEHCFAEPDHKNLSLSTSVHADANLREAACQVSARGYVGCVNTWPSRRADFVPFATDFHVHVSAMLYCALWMWFATFRQQRFFGAIFNNWWNNLACLISGFRLVVNEIFVLLVCYASCIGYWCVGAACRCHLQGSRSQRLLKMGQTGCSETREITINVRCVTSQNSEYLIVSLFGVCELYSIYAVCLGTMWLTIGWIPDFTESKFNIWNASVVVRCLCL